VARVDEARKCSEASVHYRRTLCSKVRGREASWSPRGFGDHVPARVWSGSWYQRLEQGAQNMGDCPPSRTHTPVSTGVCVFAELGTGSV
jgi:hypothetical protein